MDLGLTGQVAVITGPAKGMGAAVTRAFAAEGCRLALLGRDVAAIEPFAEAARQSGAEVLVCPCDVTDDAACGESVTAIVDAFGRIDILVNVAGGSGPIGKTGTNTTSEEFHDIVDLNMRGCFNTIKAVAPVMIIRGHGHIINIGGTFGMRGRAGRLAYSASKWGLRGITKSFALELGPHNINVNCVAPGMVDGPRFRDQVCREMALRLGISEAEAAERHAADYALRRLTTDVDVAHACLFLASSVSRQITGVDLPVDGGWAAL
jgi:NAD(P)-dependent dehydrogenase (short-subunit alcohol dehydrogenase family)